MKLIIFFGLFAITHPVFGANINESIRGAVPKTFVSACELNFPTSKIIVNFLDTPVKEEHQESIKSLTVLARKANILHSDEIRTLGLTTSELSWSLDAEFKSLRLNGSDIHCVRPIIKIGLKVASHIVHVAKELPFPSCEYNFVRDHEQRHVNLNNENIQRYGKEISTAFNERFTNKILYGPIEKINGEVQETMDKEWLPFMKETTAKMESEGMKLHQTIDTPEEYARVHTACSGKISNIIEASEKINKP